MKKRLPLSAEKGCEGRRFELALIFENVGEI